jgi:hypothetical protein
MAVSVLSRMDHHCGKHIAFIPNDMKAERTAGVLLKMDLEQPQPLGGCHLWPYLKADSPISQPELHPIS